MEILALIPARSGSKSIPNKNITTFRGKPMLAHSIEQALQAETVTRVIVSTDSELYAGISRQYGAEVPFLRPAKISADFSKDIEVFQHALNWLRVNQGYHPDICVHLRPTYPTRRVEDINRAIKMLIADPLCDSIRSITESPETPFKMWFMNEEGWLTPALETNLIEPYNSPRQILPKVFIQNAAIDVVWTRVILEQNSMTGKKIRGFVMEHFRDIDQVEQLKGIEWSGPVEIENQTFVFDLDGIIATLTPNNDYSVAEPQSKNINLIDTLYNMGNTIVIFTARGSKTGTDWTDLTRRQLAAWGVKYHQLIFGKPPGDYYIDDHSISIHDLENLVNKK